MTVPEKEIFGSDLGRAAASLRVIIVEGKFCGVRIERRDTRVGPFYSSRETADVHHTPVDWVRRMLTVRTRDITDRLFDDKAAGPGIGQGICSDVSWIFII